RLLRFVNLDRCSRAPVRAHNAPFVGERPQVTADGRFGHAEMLAQRAYIVHAGQDGFEHRLAAVRNFHVSGYRSSVGPRKAKALTHAIVIRPAAGGPRPFGGTSP